MKDINFLVSEPAISTKEEVTSQKKTVPAAQIIIFVLSFTVAILVLFIPVILIAGMEKQISAVEKSMFDPKYAELRNVKAELINVQTMSEGKKSVIYDIDNKYAPASQILLLVEQAVPSGCYLKSVSFNGGTLSLSGKAQNSMVYAEFAGNLDRLKQLQRSTGNLAINESLTPVDFSLSYAVLN